MEWREASYLIYGVARSLLGVARSLPINYFISPLSFALSLKKADNSPQSRSERSVSGTNETILMLAFQHVAGGLFK